MMLVQRCKGNHCVIGENRVRGNKCFTGNKYMSKIQENLQMDLPNGSFLLLLGIKLQVLQDPPLDSADTPLFDSPIPVPLEIEYHTMKFVSECNSVKSEEDLDDLPVINYLAARGKEKATTNTVPKCPTTRL